MLRKLPWRIALPYTLLVLAGMAALTYLVLDFAGGGEAERQRISVLIVLASSAVTLVSILLGWLLARAISKPINAVTGAAHRMAAGDLTQRVYVGGGEEVTQLSRAFNEMASSFQRTTEAVSAERNRLSAMLANMADGVVVTDGAGSVVLANLIHNAIKFTPRGGRVEVGVEEQPDSVLLRVTDTGTGISAEDLPHVFERFYKADKSRSTEGAGLGLAIAKHIVQAHGRRIWAESVEGRGSTFSFTLPLPTPSKK